jgi:hypothetical protein
LVRLQGFKLRASTGGFSSALCVLLRAVQHAFNPQVIVANATAFIG